MKQSTKERGEVKDKSDCCMAEVEQRLDDRNYFGFDYFCTKCNKRCGVYEPLNEERRCPTCGCYMGFGGYIGDTIEVESEYECCNKNCKSNNNY